MNKAILEDLIVSSIITSLTDEITSNLAKEAIVKLDFDSICGKAAIQLKAILIKEEKSSGTRWTEMKWNKLKEYKANGADISVVLSDSFFEGLSEDSIRKNYQLPKASEPQVEIVNKSKSK